MLPLNNNQPAGVQPVNPVPSASKGASTFAKVMDMLTVFASKWYWFVICLALGLGGSYMYLQVTPPVYTRDASILIKNDFQSSSSGSGASGSAMNMFGGNVDVNNELFTLRSPHIADATARTLHLEVNCYLHGHFHDEIVYGTSLPVQIVPLELDDQESAGFMFDLKSRNPSAISPAMYLCTWIVFLSKR